MDVFEKIRQDVPILDIIQHYFSPDNIKRSGKGKYFVNPCPFCGGHKGAGKGGNNSCSVDAESNFFNCFACGEKGSAIDFVMKMKRLASPLDAAKEIDSVCQLGLDFSPNGKANGKPKPPPDPAIETRKKIFKAAASFYHQNLLNDDKAMQILLKFRNYSREFISGNPEKNIDPKPIGYTGNSSGMLYNSLKTKFTDDELLESGLVVKSNKNGKLYDFLGSQFFVFFHLDEDGKQVCNFSLKDALKGSVPSDQVRDGYRLRSEYKIGDIRSFNQQALNGKSVIFVEGENDVLQILNVSEKEHPIANKDFANKEWADHLRSKLKHVETVYLWFDPDKSGNDYVRSFFDQFWGDFPIKVIEPSITTEEGSEQKTKTYDPDEFLRAFKSATRLQKLKDNSIEISNWLIQRVQESDDTYTNIMNLRFVTDRFRQINDNNLVKTALSAIKKAFSDNSVGQIIKENYQNDLQSITASGASKKHLPYFEHEGIYFRRQGETKVGLSNFYLRICDIIRMDDAIYYRCKLVNDNGDVAEDVIFNAAERTNLNKFKERCATKGGFYFTGMPNDLAGVWQLEESRDNLAKTYYIKHYGYVKQEKLWLFENCAVKDNKIYDKNEEGFIHIDGKNYKAFDVLVYSGATPKLDLGTKYTKQFAQDVANAFHGVMDAQPDGTVKSYKGYLFYGFLPAVIYSAELFQRFGFFPFLFSYGPSGTGKTQVTSRLFECFGFLASPESWPGATEPGTYQFLQALGSMPCWYDEFLNDKTFDRLLGTIKNVYNRTGSGKGGLDSRTIREVNGCFWMSGEDNPNNEAVLSRSVMFRFDPINKHKQPYYQFLTDNRKSLSLLSRQLLIEKTDKSADEFIKRADDLATYIMEHANGRIDFRVAMNHAIPAAGLQMMGLEIPENFIEYVVKHASMMFEHKLTESPVYQFFGELSYLYNRTHFLNESVRYDSATDELAVHFSSAIKVIQKELRHRGETLKIKADSVQDYLKDLEGCDAVGRRTYFNNGLRLRCMIFKLSQLPENIRNIAEFEDRGEVE